VKTACDTAGSSLFINSNMVAFGVLGIEDKSVTFGSISPTLAVISLM
jgi:hypothetical protein